MKVPDLNDLIEDEERKADVCDHCGMHYDHHWRVGGLGRICPMVLSGNAMVYKEVTYFKYASS